ncbi:hypothetical protein [Flavobacterium sp.]|uniref:hypothetical protein n=1 Tax=Flavobacterium sp. TaxID=239 RepID=UPI00374DF84B
MNKELVMIGGGVTGGALSNGIAGLFPTTTNPMLVNAGMALATGFGITKITGTDGKSQFLRSMLIGATIIRGIGFVKNVFEKAGIASKLSAPTKVNQFLLGATGLGCPHDGLAGTFRGADGQLYEYDESGLAGTFMDEDGNIHEIADGLNAVYVDEDGNVVDGLNGYEEDAGLFGYDDDEDGLYGVEEKERLF